MYYTQVNCCTKQTTSLTVAFKLT